MSMDTASRTSSPPKAPPHVGGARGSKRSVVPGRHVRLSEQTVPVAAGRHGHPSQPVIQLVRDGDVVRAIDITCGCGQRIRVRCLYEEELRG